MTRHTSMDPGYGSHRGHQKRPIATIASDQIDLLSGTPDAPLAPPSPEPTIEERFQAFDQAHPWVYQEIRRRCVMAMDEGAHRIGLKKIFEDIRAELRIPRVAGEAFHLNNDFTSLYARKVRDECAELRPLIETRTRKAS